MKNLVEVKFKIDDNVYFIFKGDVVYSTIKNIIITKRDILYEIEHIVDHESTIVEVLEQDCYENIDEVINYYNIKISELKALKATKGQAISMDQFSFGVTYRHLDKVVLINPHYLHEKQAFNVDDEFRGEDEIGVIGDIDKIYYKFKRGLIRHKLSTDITITQMPFHNGDMVIVKKPITDTAKQDFIVINMTDTHANLLGEDNSEFAMKFDELQLKYK